MKLDPRRVLLGVAALISAGLGSGLAYLNEVLHTAPMHTAAPNPPPVVGTSPADTADDHRQSDWLCRADYRLPWLDDDAVTLQVSAADFIGEDGQILDPLVILEPNAPGTPDTAGTASAPDPYDRLSDHARPAETGSLGSRRHAGTSTANLNLVPTAFSWRLSPQPRTATTSSTSAPADQTTPGLASTEGGTDSSTRSPARPSSQPQATAPARDFGFSGLDPLLTLIPAHSHTAPRPTTNGEQDIPSATTPNAPTLTQWLPPEPASLIDTGASSLAPEASTGAVANTPVPSPNVIALLGVAPLLLIGARLRR